MKHIIRSAQGMPDIMPIPWRERGLSDVGFSSKSVLAARGMGIHCVGDLVETFKGALTDFPGVGPTTATKIQQAIAAYQEGDV